MTELNRRDALKAFSGMASALGLSAAAITEHQAEGLALVMLKAKFPISQQTAEDLRKAWENGVWGTPLQGVRVMVLEPGLDIELVRK